MKKVDRSVQQIIEKHLFKGKILILYGARQVGKTTMLQRIQEQNPQAVYINCDEPDVMQALTGKTSTELRLYLGTSNLILLDEAQHIRDIGRTLKLLIDTYPDVQIVATGSSSFDLSNKITEPLTGRSYEFQCYPFSVGELVSTMGEKECRRMLEQRMIYGMYPEVVLRPEEAQNILFNLRRSYLYKDVLEFQAIKHPDAIDRLLQALALQIGQEVSYTELARLVGIDQKTVSQYIQLLEQAFIIFRLRPFHRNVRTELRKLRKIYFVDTGIRNAIVRNFNPLHLRQDTGQLWENFVISERMKRNASLEYYPKTAFWRTHQQQEIDYLEEEGGRLLGMECKWTSGRSYKSPQPFREAYPSAQVDVVTQENWMQILL
jgi:predicted AAA+ superfamily ATPase